MTGIGVAAGPVTGGPLLTPYHRPAVFAALVPVTLIAFALQSNSATIIDGSCAARP